MSKIISDIPESEVKELLNRLQNKIEQVILSEFPGKTKEDDDLPVTFMISIKHDETQLTVWVGNGCPACAIIRALEWGLDQGITHEDGKPLMIGIPIGWNEKVDKKDIH